MATANAANLVKDAGKFNAFADQINAFL